MPTAHLAKLGEIHPKSLVMDIHAPSRLFMSHLHFTVSQPYTIMTAHVSLSLPGIFLLKHMYSRTQF